MDTVCISHIKDVDGLGAAALVRAATGATVMLADYNELMGVLASVPEGTESLYLCDLGVDESRSGELIASLSRIARTSNVCYIDHHYMPNEVKRELRRSGIVLVHDVRECTSMLAFKTLKKSLPPEASSVALFGAVTDYMDSSPMSRPLMERTDRQFILAEATILSLAVSRAAGGGFPQTVVRELALMKQPHEIDQVPKLAIEQMKELLSLSRKVGRLGRNVGRLAYMETHEQGTGNVAKLLIGAFGVPVGVAFREKEPGWYEVSLRATSECRVHLGRAIGKIVLRLGGTGGGHRLAAGCRIPVDSLDGMLKKLEAQV